MKMISMKCPQCSGSLEVSENSKQAKCPFCNTVVYIDDEVKHVQFDNSEQAGYDFEQGRIRAQQDASIRAANYQYQALQAQREAERKRKNLKWWIIGWIFCFPIPLTILIVKSTRLKRIYKIALLSVLWLAIIVGAIANKSNNRSIWASDITPLDKFEYRINGDSIILTDYRGRDKKVKIASTYKLDGKTYKVTSLEGVFTLDSVSSVIVPEGVTYIQSNAFNSCGVKYLYLPSTLTEFTGWNYFHDGEKLYYGGSQSQLNKLYTGRDLEFKQIIYNTKVSDLTE